MTLKNLSKILDKYEEQLGYNFGQRFDQLKNLPFYNWPDSKRVVLNTLHISRNSNTFNNAIGLPKKNGVAMPLFDYEQLLFDTLQSNKQVWIKKATGLGITEFMLRYMAWPCPRGNTLPGSQMCVVTEPRIELTITLIDRPKGLF